MKQSQIALMGLLTSIAMLMFVTGSHYGYFSVAFETPEGTVSEKLPFLVGMNSYAMGLERCDIVTLAEPASHIYKGRLTAKLSGETNSDAIFLFYDINGNSLGTSSKFPMGEYVEHPFFSEIDAIIDSNQFIICVRSEVDKTFSFDGAKYITIDYMPLNTDVSEEAQQPASKSSLTKMSLGIALLVGLIGLVVWRYKK